MTHEHVAPVSASAAVRLPLFFGRTFCLPLTGTFVINGFILRQNTVKFLLSHEPC